MPAVYIAHPGAAVKLDGECLLVTKDDETLATIPLGHVSRLVLIGRVALTSPASVALLRHDIPAAFLSRGGRYLGSLLPRRDPAWAARLGQYRVYSNPSLRLVLARRIVSAKAAAMLAILDRYSANYAELRDPALRARLKAAEGRGRAVDSPASLLGVEGGLTAAYFEALRACNRSGLRFGERSTRPPKDELNALLSFGYSILGGETSAVLEATGLDPYLGIYHEPFRGRPSLALDVMEPFRHLAVDRAVLAAANLRRFRSSDFRVGTGGGLRLRRPALARFLTIYEEAMLDVAHSSLLPPARSGRALAVRDALRIRCEQLAAWFADHARPSPAIAGPAPHSEAA